MSDSAWTEKGATLSDKSARNEFGLEQDEIIEAIKNGKLQYRINYMHGNPYFKLIRSEVESYVTEKYGEKYLENRKLEHKLIQINKEIRKLRSELKRLEEKKAELLEKIGE
jgi:NADPH-dependent curcumin reductase CurA